MQYLMQKWTCSSCGRSNVTEMALNGTAKCDHCAAVVKIQPSRARGGETPEQLAEFIRADPKHRRPEST
jgi:hypothetical protein